MWPRKAPIPSSFSLSQSRPPPELSPGRTPTLLATPAPGSPTSPSRPQLILTRSESAALDYAAAQRAAQKLAEAGLPLEAGLAKRLSAAGLPAFEAVASRPPSRTGMSLAERRASVQVQPPRRLSLADAPAGPKSTTIPLRRYSGVPRPMTPTSPLGNGQNPMDALHSPTKEGESKAWHLKPLVLTPARTVGAPLTHNASGSRHSMLAGERPISPFGGAVAPLHRRRSLGYNNSIDSTTLSSLAHGQVHAHGLSRRDSAGSNGSSVYLRGGYDRRQRSASEDTTVTKEASPGMSQPRNQDSPDSSVGEWSHENHEPSTEQSPSRDEPIKDWVHQHRRPASALGVVRERGRHGSIEEVEEGEGEGDDELDDSPDEPATPKTPLIEFIEPTPVQKAKSGDGKQAPLSPPPRMPLPGLPATGGGPLARAFDEVEQLLPAGRARLSKSVKYDQFWDGHTHLAPGDSSPSQSGNTTDNSPVSVYEPAYAQPGSPLGRNLSTLGGGAPQKAQSVRTVTSMSTAGPNDHTPEPAHNPQYIPIKIKPTAKSPKSVKSTRSARSAASVITIPARGGSHAAPTPPASVAADRELNHTRSQGFVGHARDKLRNRHSLGGSRSTMELRSDEVLDVSTASSHRGLAIWPPPDTTLTVSAGPRLGVPPGESDTDLSGVSTPNSPLVFYKGGPAAVDAPPAGEAAVVDRRGSQLSPRPQSPLPPSPIPALSFSHPDPAARPFPPPPSRPRHQPRDPRSFAQGPDEFLEVLLTEPPPERTMSPPPAALHAAHARPASAMGSFGRASGEGPALVHQPNISWSARMPPPPVPEAAAAVMASPASSRTATSATTPKPDDKKSRRPSLFGRFMSSGSKASAGAANRQSVTSTTSASTAASHTTPRVPEPRIIAASPVTAAPPLPPPAPVPTINRRAIQIPAQGQVRPSSMASQSSRRSSASVRQKRSGRRDSTEGGSSINSGYLPKHPPVSPLFGESGGYGTEGRSYSPSPLSPPSVGSSSRPTSHFLSDRRSSVASSRPNSAFVPDRRSSVVSANSHAVGRPSPTFSNGPAPSVASGTPSRVVNDDIEEELADWSSARMGSSRPESLYSVASSKLAARAPMKPYALPPGLGSGADPTPIKARRPRVALDPYGSLTSPKLRVASALSQAGPPAIPRRGSSAVSADMNGSASPASTYASAQSGNGGERTLSHRPSQVDSWHLPSGSGRAAGREMAAAVGGYTLGPKGEMVRVPVAAPVRLEPREAFRLQSLER